MTDEEDEAKRIERRSLERFLTTKKLRDSMGAARQGMRGYSAGRGGLPGTRHGVKTPRGK